MCPHPSQPYGLQSRLSCLAFQPSVPTLTIPYLPSTPLTLQAKPRSQLPHGKEQVKLQEMLPSSTGSLRSLKFHLVLCGLHLMSTYWSRLVGRDFSSSALCAKSIFHRSSMYKTARSRAAVLTASPGRGLPSFWSPDALWGPS